MAMTEKNQEKYIKELIGSPNLCDARDLDGYHSDKIYKNKCYLKSKQ